MFSAAHQFLPFLLLLAVVTGVVAKPFDYHSVRGRKANPELDSKYEGESAPLRGSARVQSMTAFDPNAWSGGAHALWYGKIGDSMQTSIRVKQAGRYRVALQLTAAPDYGRFTLSWNGQELRNRIDLYDSKVRLADLIDLGEMTLQEGTQNLMFTLTGAHSNAVDYRVDQYLLGWDYLTLERLDPDPLEVDAEGDAIDSSAMTLQDLRPIMAEYCHRCHGGEKTKGKIDLKSLTGKQDFLEDIELTRKTLEALEYHEMPPGDEEQLSSAEHAQLIALFRGYVDEYVQTTSSLPFSVMRRMNRYEYNNAVRDLLSLKGDIFALPEKPLRAMVPYFEPASGRFPDTVRVANRALGKNMIEQHILTGVTPFAIDLQAEHGFNNRGEELSLSPILLESFLTLGRSIVHAKEFDDYTAVFEALFQCDAGLPILEQRALAEKHLQTLLERAFRGRSDATVVGRYLEYFDKEQERTRSFTQSMKAVVGALLASPRFIYVTEGTPIDQQETSLTGYELATRLSFFLWSSIPDPELLTLARNGELLKPNVYRGQIKRLLEDPRSQALSQSFARQWLRLDQLITAVPDFERFEEYYARIGCEQWKFGLQTMLEPLLLFESILVEDRSIMLMVDANYSYRSDEMVSWYGEDNPFGERGNRNRFDTHIQNFNRRNLETRREGGVITSAATLTMTSSPLRTNPINRGSWVATVIFNRPPPPPPDVIPEIEEDDAAIEAQGLTLRQRLVQHQVNPSCVSCHQKIDPLGFALENYDAVGRWRDQYRSGLPINAAGELFGEAKFKDIVGLKDALLENSDWFMRAFSEHLLSYALGRELEVADIPAIERILRKVQADHGKFSTVVFEVATSYPFLHKTNQSPPND